jgi:hypothetical protein
MMTKYLIILFTLTSFWGYSQQYYNESNFEEFIDYSSKTLKLSYQSNKIEGTFIELEGKDYRNYLLVKGKNNLNWVIKPYGMTSIYGLEILKGDFDEVVNEFKKGKNHKKVEVLFSNITNQTSMNEFSFVSKTIMEMKLESKKREDERRLLVAKKEEQEKINEQKFQDDLIKSGLIGTYIIKILTHSNFDYKSLNTFGKIIVTEIGVTIETDIPSMGLIRSVYMNGFSEPLEGSLSCTISKGSRDFFSLRLNKKDNVGGLTQMSGRSSTTTTFLIIK